MRHRLPATYLFLFFSLIGLMSLPKESTERLQGTVIAAFAPLWHQTLAVNSLTGALSNTSSGCSHEELEKLRLENTLLQEEILHLKDVMQQELRLINHMNLLADEDPLSTQTLKARHRMGLKRLLQMHLNAIPAKIIFRSSDSWNSSCWINVGSLTNETIGTEVIAKNSPVLLGNAVIGVIDYVGKQQARVRFLTDSALTPSVRVVRGQGCTKILDEKLNSLIQLLTKMPGAIDNSEQQNALITHLESAAEHLSKKEQVLYLAKGELHGASQPLWNNQRHLLKGIGFNYDYADGEGPARDLRTGKYIFQDNSEKAIPIVKTGDFLITTGMDGVFPAGLMVAEVAKVSPLKEGDYYYELEALPVVGNFDDLSFVFVIPPVGYDGEEHPSLFEWTP